MPSGPIKSAGRARSARRARLVVEALERRSLLTGNLWITGAQLVELLRAADRRAGDR